MIQKYFVAVQTCITREKKTLQALCTIDNDNALLLGTTEVSINLSLAILFPQSLTGWSVVTALLA